MAKKVAAKPRGKPRAAAIEKKGSKRKPARQPPPPSSESEESISEDEPTTQRVVAPKRIFKGDDAMDFISWKRHIRLWRSRYPNVDGGILGSYLMDAVAGKAEKCVNARVKPDQETYITIMDALEKRYGEKKIPAISKYIQKLNSMARGKGNLADFLDDYEEARQEAILHGWTPSPETDGIQLMQACGLSTTQQVGILSRLQAEGGSPSYTSMMNELELLASTLKMADDMNTNTNKVEGTALFAPSKGGKGASKGGGKSAGKGGKGLCKFYAKTGRCSYGDKCKFSHGGKGHNIKGGYGKSLKGKSHGKGGGVCYDYQQGKCWRNNCKFAHVKQHMDAKPKDEPGAAPAGAAPPPNPH